MASKSKASFRKIKRPSFHRWWWSFFFLLFLMMQLLLLSFVLYKSYEIHKVLLEMREFLKLLPSQLNPPRVDANHGTALSSTGFWKQSLVFRITFRDLAFTIILFSIAAFRINGGTFFGF